MPQGLIPEEAVKHLLVVDCQVSGISGDMILGALIDLYEDEEGIRDAIEALESIKGCIKGCGRLKIPVKETTRGGFRARRVKVEFEDYVECRSGAEIKEAVTRCAEHLGLSIEARKLALRTVETLLEAESKVHGEPVEKVHLHEAGSTDTIVDVAGAAYLLDDLNLLRDTVVYSTPVSVGGGTLRFSHGITSTPAPATLEIVRSTGFPIVGGPVDKELATPTGVAILVNLVDEVSPFYPPMKPQRVGYGAGMMEIPGVPNVLRVILGEPVDGGFIPDEVYVLETNLDDVTGESLGYVMDRLLRCDGVRDVSLIPMFTKKGRPGNIVKVIADRGGVEEAVRLLMEETGTLGVRFYRCKRLTLERELIKVEVEVGGLRETALVKVSRDRDGRVIQIKPEYEDARRIALKTGRPLRSIIRSLTEEALRRLERRQPQGRKTLTSSAT